jgi:hypothetical protein
MNNFVNTASVETSRFLVLFIMKLNGLIIKSLCMCQLKKSFDNTNNYNNHHGDYFLTMSLRINRPFAVTSKSA